MPALQTGHTCLVGRVSNHWCKQGQQKRCPHRLITASLAVSRQMLHSNVLSWPPPSAAAELPVLLGPGFEFSSAAAAAAAASAEPVAGGGAALAIYPTKIHFTLKYSAGDSSGLPGASIYTHGEVRRDGCGEQM